MKEYGYRFAGMNIRLLLPEDMEFPKEYRLAPFAAAPTPQGHTFRFETVESLSAPAGRCLTRQPSFWIYEEGERRVRYLGNLGENWTDASVRAEHRGKDHRILLKKSEFGNRLYCKTVLDVLAAEHLLVRSNALVFHCAFIEWKGKAVLFTAPSETGKSTQADLWHRHRGVTIVNGDRAAIRVTESGEILAEGIPFSGSSPYCENRSLPLAGIVYLAQAPQTTIRKLRGAQAFARVWEGVTVNTWDRTDLELASVLTEKIAQTVPVWYMPCTPDEDAVITLERELERLVNV